MDVPARSDASVSGRVGRRRAPLAPRGAARDLAVGVTVRATPTHALRVRIGSATMRLPEAPCSR